MFTLLFIDEVIDVFEETTYLEPFVVVVKCYEDGRDGG